jgi:STE24 endopeptidase
MLRSLKILLLFLSLVPFAATASAQQAPPAPSPQTQTGSAPAYSLSGDKLQKAIEVSRIREIVHFVQAGWDITAILVLLWLGVFSRVRNIAENISSNVWIQCVIYMPLFLVLLTLIDLPLDLYMHTVSLKYGLSVQTWRGWIWDQTKGLLIGVALSYLPAMLLKLIFRKAPQKWWLIFWGASVPTIIVLVFIAPVVLEPLMNKYESLQPKSPALVDRLEQIVSRGGLVIPPARMFWMDASSKTTEMNAYVTGIGASKRVVVWDTTIAKLNLDETSVVFGHEMGHYVLNHIWRGIAFTIAVLFVTLFLAKLFIAWAIARYGGSWQVRGLSDWASLAVLMLALSIFGFLLEPVTNGFSRSMEHQADVYGMEAVHGIVPNPQESARSAFQKLGEASLVDPNPNAFVEFWTGSHPSIASRAAFAASYDPWQPGKQPEFFKK